MHAELAGSGTAERVLGILGLVNQACDIKGMAEGDAMVMAPIDYTRLVFAIILGYACCSAKSRTV